MKPKQERMRSCSPNKLGPLASDGRRSPLIEACFSPKKTKMTLSACLADDPYRKHFESAIDWVTKVPIENLVAQKMQARKAAAPAASSGTSSHPSASQIPTDSAFLLKAHKE